MINVLIVNGNFEYGNILKSKLQKNNNINVVDFVNNGKKLLERLQDGNVDVVVTEFLLPDIDGVLAVDKIRQLQLPKTPKIFMLTPFYSKDLADEAYETGVNCLMIEPINIEDLIEKIENSQKRTKTKKKTETRVLDGLLSYMELEIIVTNMMNEAGVPTVMSGYQHLREAIIIVAMEPEYLNSITGKLYPYVAKKFKTSAVNIERSIRHAVEATWTKGNMEFLQEIFGYTISAEKGKTTNTEFIAMLVEKIRVNLQYALN